LGGWNWQKFYTELKYIVSIGITLVGVTIIMNHELTKAKVKGMVTEAARMGQRIIHIIMNQELMKAKVEGVVTEVARMGQRIVHIIMNQELTKAKVEGVVMEVARMGQQINHMDKKFEEMEKKWTNF